MRLILLLLLGMSFTSCCKKQVEVSMEFHYPVLADSIQNAFVKILRTEKFNYNSIIDTIHEVELNAVNNYTASFYFDEADKDFSFIVLVDGTNYIDTINEITLKQKRCSIEDFQLRFNDLWYTGNHSTIIVD